jgi:hypothetical protein
LLVHNLFSPELTEQYEEKEAELATPNPLYCSNHFCSQFVKPYNMTADVATIVSELLNPDTTRKEAYNLAEDKREEANTGFDSGGTLDGLEPYGKVIKRGHHGSAGEENSCGGRQDAALREDTGRNSGVLGPCDLHSCETQQE